VLDVAVWEGILLYFMPVHQLPYGIIPAILIKTAKNVLFKLASEGSQEVCRNSKKIKG
jgi:hypothetical protein